MVPSLMWYRYWFIVEVLQTGCIILIDETILKTSGELVFVIEDSEFKVLHPVTLSSYTLNTKIPVMNFMIKVKTVHLFMWSSETVWLKQLLSFLFVLLFIQINSTDLAKVIL